MSGFSLPADLRRRTRGDFAGAFFNKAQNVQIHNSSFNTIDNGTIIQDFTSQTTNINDSFNNRQTNWGPYGGGAYTPPFTPAPTPSPSPPAGGFQRTPGHTPPMNFPQSGRFFQEFPPGHPQHPQYRHQQQQQPNGGEGSRYPQSQSTTYNFGHVNATAGHWGGRDADDGDRPMPQAGAGPNQRPQQQPQQPGTLNFGHTQLRSNRVQPAGAGPTRRRGFAKRSAAPGDGIGGAYIVEIPEDPLPEPQARPSASSNTSSSSVSSSSSAYSAASLSSPATTPPASDEGTSGDLTQTVVPATAQDDSGIKLEAMEETAQVVIATTSAAQAQTGTLTASSEVPSSESASSVSAGTSAEVPLSTPLLDSILSRMADQAGADSATSDPAASTVDASTTATLLVPNCPTTPQAVKPGVDTTPTPDKKRKRDSFKALFKFGSLRSKMRKGASKAESEMSTSAA
uniref:Uncharacterized protein n=1 Tax=Mycena chlorophos TaxID=658473 RepID=A0ABQ0KWL4_MYCCL|nr:predicted protein [Mycena chlorophos]